MLEKMQSKGNFNTLLVGVYVSKTIRFTIWEYTLVKLP